MTSDAGYHHSDPSWVDPKPLNDELVADLERIYQLLIERGADLDAVNPQSGQTLPAHYGK